MKNNKPKLLIIGHARHGKDTVCEILRDNYEFSFKSSSEICSEKVIFPILSKRYRYKTLKQCFEDRVNHRSEWFTLIKAYNSNDPARLGKYIFSKYDIYCGLRSREEFLALKEEKVFDFSIWVDASKRKPPEDISSFDIKEEDCDFIINNNICLELLYEEITKALNTIYLFNQQNEFFNSVVKPTLGINHE